MKLKLDRRGLHFPDCPRFDEWSDAHPWKCVALLSALMAVALLAALAVALIVKIGLS